MHFVGPDQLHGFEERLTTDIYPAGLDWVPDWRLAEDEKLAVVPRYLERLRAGPCAATLQIDYDAEVVDHARQAIVDSAREADRPLLLVASFTHPHDPYEVPVSHWERYDGIEIDAPTFPIRRTLPTRRRRRLRAMVDADGSAGAGAGAGCAPRLLRRRQPRRRPPRHDPRHPRRAGLADDTIVIVTSDHGDMLGERGLWYKMAPSRTRPRAALRPCPGRFAPVGSQAPVSLLDLVPTLVDLAGGRRRWPPPSGRCQPPPCSRAIPRPSGTCR